MIMRCNATMMAIEKSVKRKETNQQRAVELLSMLILKQIGHDS